MIRAATSDDKKAIIAVADAIGLFESQELEELGNMLTEYFDSKQDKGSSWIVYDYGGIIGVAYYAPEPYGYGTWNLYFIAVHPEHQGKGYGGQILQYVEQTLAAQGERLLLIETSGLPNFERTRKFYCKHGYQEEARIKEFYRPGEDKIIFRKMLNTLK